MQTPSSALRSASVLLLCGLAAACGALKKSSSTAQSAPSGNAQASGNGVPTPTKTPIKITPIISGTSPSGAGSSIAPTAVPDAQASFETHADLVAKAGVCGAWYIQRVLKGASPAPAVADHDLPVTFTLTYFQGDMQTTMAIYSDDACTTKVSGDMSGANTSANATITMKAGATAVAAYVKATPANPAPANDFVAKIAFSSPTVAAGSPATGSVYALYEASEIQVDTSVALVPPLAETVGMCLLAGFSTSGDADVETNDVAFSLAFAGNVNVKAYADSVCTQTITSVTMPAGTNLTDFFIKATGPGSITVDWAAPSVSVTNQTTYIGTAEVSGS